MDKKTSYSLRGGLAGFIAGGLYEFFRQYSNRDPRIQFEPDWWEILRCALIGAFLGALGGLALGALRDHQIDAQYGGVMALFLLNVDNEHKVSDPSYHVQRKLNKIITLLKSEFDGCLESDPYIGGSVEKGVATIYSDYDLNLHFSSNAGTLEEIYHRVFEYFNSDYSDATLKKVRAQGKSIGLFFEVDGQEVQIDVVPKRIQKGGQAMSMYVNPALSASGKSWTKTDPQLQSLALPTSPSYQKIVRLLKIWSQHNQIKVGSTYLMYLVSEAFSHYSGKIPGKIDTQLVVVLKYIANNLHGKRVVDPSNSANVISDSLSESDKDSLIEQIHKMLDDIESMPQHIVTYFPTVNS